MSECKSPNESDDVSFDALFTEAEKHDGYWISKAKYQFTEEMLARLSELEISKQGLAQRMSVNAAFVSKLCRGTNNFTISTMVRVASALECELHTHLVPKGKNVQWIDFLNDEPQVENVCWSHNEFTPVLEARLAEGVNGAR